MNLQNLTISSTSDLHVLDSLNVALLGFKVKKGSSTTTPNDNTLIVYVDKQPSSNPSSERRQYIFELDDVLKYYNQVSDEFTLKVAISNNDVIFNAYVERKIGENNSILSESLFEEVEGIPVVLFEGENYIYTNYTNAEITAIYPKDNDESSLLLLTSIFAGHRKNADGDFCLDDIYFKDAFTKSGNDLDLEVNGLSVDCISSNNDNFSLDRNGNLIVSSLNVGGNAITSSGLELTVNPDDICDIVYPINSIYLSVSDVNPSTLFGGTWVQLKDRFLLGAGDNYTNGDIGGEAEHILSIDEMPAHNHTFTVATGTLSSTRYAKTQQGGSYHTPATNYTGGSQPHNNMPPYLVVYMWKRTA